MPIVRAYARSRSRWGSQPGALGPLRWIAGYLEPDVYKQVQTGMAAQAYCCNCRQQRNARIPKSNRMPDAPHSVKVETQVMDCVEDLSQDFVRRINVPQIGPRVALAHTA